MGEQWNCKGSTGTFFGVMGEFYILMEVVLTQIYTSGKKSQNRTLKNPKIQCRTSLLKSE